MANYFTNGILNKPCKFCGCQITFANCVVAGSSFLSRCRKCHNEKQRIATAKYQPNHRHIAANGWLKREYGLTLEEYNKIKEKQNNLCAICKKENDTTERKLSVDHDHKTGKIRELLCNKCNSILAQSNDNVEILEKCINYLIKHTDMEKEFKFQHD